jgi:hypothetical protein
MDLYVQDLIEAGDPIPLDQGTIELAEPAVLINVRHALRALSRRGDLSGHSKRMASCCNECGAVTVSIAIKMAAAWWSPTTA